MRIVYIAVLLLASILASVRCQNMSNPLEFPRLIYMTPKEPAELTLNEKNSFTNELNFGWVLKESQDIDFLFYLFVKGRVTDLTEIDTSFVYFTTSQNTCNLSAPYEVYNPATKYPKEAQLVFKLEFIVERSKLFQTNNLNRVMRRRSRLHKIETRSADGAPVLDTSVNSTLLVGHSVIMLRYSPTNYYACVHFSRKKSPAGSALRPNGTLRFVHQGSGGVWTSVITTQDMLPIWAVVILYLILLMFSSLCSGLNLGLMSLDLSELNLLKKIGSASEKIYAKKIYPLRAHGNLLLCSILLGMYMFCSGFI